MQFSFGSGALWGERTDKVGTGIGPRQFGLLQEVQIDVSFTEKKLYGQFQFAQLIARGQGAITGTAKFAQISGLLYSDIFFGVTPAIGQYAVSQLEANLVPTLAPFTVISANASNYADDLGVVSASGESFNRVTAPPGKGQYSVNFMTGVYNFSPLDAGASVIIGYTYNIGSSGTRLNINNQLMGTTPVFKATFYDTYKAKGATLRLNACTATKLVLPTKLEDWTIQNFEFSAMADDAGSIGILSTAE